MNSAAVVWDKLTDGRWVSPYYWPALSDLSRDQTADPPAATAPGSDVISAETVTVGR